MSRTLLSNTSLPRKRSLAMAYAPNVDRITAMMAVGTATFMLLSTFVPKCQ